MSDPTCKYFEKCSAPLCPNDTTVQQGNWYADEEICKVKPPIEWMKKQKRIQNKNKKSKIEGYFTLQMLETDFTIGRKLQGIVENQRKETADEVKERIWLEKHKVKKERSEEAKKAQSERMKAYWKGRK